MAKRTVILEDLPQDPEATEPVEEMTPEEQEAVEREEAEKRERALAPYRAFAQAEKDQDELLAEMLFENTLKELEE